MTKYLREENEITVFKFVVSSTSLRSLKLHIESDSDYEKIWPHCNLELEASSLEYLKLVGYISRIHVQESLGSLVEANFGINIRPYDWNPSGVGDSLVKALRTSTCAKVLTLSGDSMRALGFATISPRAKFKRLMKLEAGNDWCCSSLVDDILKSSDNLEVLTLASKYFKCTQCSTAFVWTAPVEVPRCLSNSLKAVEFTCYSGYDCERGLIGYMLKHGSALEVMKISCESYTYMKNVKYKLLQEICKFPRKSPTCKIEFSC